MSYKHPILTFCFFAWTLASSAQDAHTFLQTSLQKYVGLTSYSIEGTRESTTIDDIQRDWHKEGFILAKAPGKRYHYDIRMPDLWDVVISDGTSEWTLQPWKNEYMKRPVPELTPKASASDDAIRARAARYAQNYVEDIAHEKFQAEEFLPDEVITIAGEQIPCRVVRATYQSNDDMPPPDFPVRTTFWIEKERGIARKFSTVARYGFSKLQPLRRPTTTYTTSYTKVVLGSSTPESLFNFVPPPAAHMVPRLFVSDGNIDLSGLPAPPLDLQTFDGKPFDAKSLMGHPVLLEFWASWCVPCVQQMRSVGDLAEKYSEHGLIVIGINWSDDRNTALEFLRKNNYDWLNLRDVKGETAKSWMLNGVPLLAIIDPEGTVAYYHSGYEQPLETAIVEALKKVDPKFSGLSASCGVIAKVP
jgi:thiol-disulfide isomerase/thioredoxin/outer membrane lipoprotein-sorting protein